MDYYSTLFVPMHSYVEKNVDGIRIYVHGTHEINNSTHNGGRHAQYIYEYDVII